MTARPNGLGWCCLALALAMAGCGTGKNATAPQDRPTPRTALDDDVPLPGITTVDLPAGIDPARGATPMGERVAVLGLLNKRNGVAREVTLKPGQATRIGDVVIRLRACEQTAPWEQPHYTGAFVQLDVKQLDQSWRRVFSGWLYKERPALNVVQQPIYDVWTKSCAMRFPDGGPDSVAAGNSGSASGEGRSSAKKSPEKPAAAEPAPTTPSSAVVNNAT